MKHYAAGIVLFKPDITRLKKNIEAVTAQVDIVYCYNNGSNNFKEIRELLKSFSKVKLIHNDKNVGIATALNVMASQAISDGYLWLLTLDQDSVCPAEMINCFSQYINRKNVGIICPIHIDRRRPKEIYNQQGVAEVDYCITSGSFINLNIYQIINGFDDYLFIDCVDNDYCYRVRRAGYLILCIYDVVLDHEMGELTQNKFSKVYLKLGTLLSSKKIKALSYKRKVSPMRVYYSTRNIVYLSRKYDSPFYKFSIKFALYNGFSDIVRGEHKIKVAKSFISGFYDGLRKQINVD